MGQWSNLTANFLSRSCRLILLVLAISTAVPFTFGINTAHAQTVPTASWQSLGSVPTIGRRIKHGLEFNVRVSQLRGLANGDFSYIGVRGEDGFVVLHADPNTVIKNYTPEEDHFSITLAANSVRLNGVSGPANAVTFAYTARPSITLRLDTGNPTDRITRNRGIDVTLASNFDHNTDTWGYSTNFGTTYIAGSGTHFGLPDGVYRAGFVRVRQTVKGTISDDDFLQRFTFDATRPTINLNGGDITLTAGQTYTEQASVSDILDTSVRLRVGGDTLDTNTAGTYDLTYDAQDTAGNNAVQLTRTVTVTEPPTLSALTVSPGTLSPDFDPAITAYNVIVGAGVNLISFTPTFSAGTVVIEVARVSGGMISSGSTSTRGFSGTRTTYNIAVTHGGVSTTYSVTATRNTAPVADAGDDDTAATHAPVALDGSGSSDPNSHVGDTLSYAWEHTLTNSATPATAITLPDATAESPTFTPTAAGAYTFTLTVTDSVGASHTDTVVITVTEPPVTLSTDSTLSALEVSAGSLNPAFASGTDAYAVSVANGVTSIRITPTVTDATGATVTVGKSGATPVAVAGGEASEKIALVPGENPINIIVTAEDTSTQTYIVTVTRTANTAPEITGNATLDYAEGRTDSVATYTATDTENNAITWSLSGTDAGSLTIGATSGILTFNTTPDFETKSTYSITITATDDGTPPMTDTQAVAVTVTNVEEGVGMVAISGTAQVGMVLTAGTVTGDPDVVASVDSHEWQSAPDGTTTYAAYNPAATGSTYTPGVDDVGRTIRVVATYTDGHGGGKKVASAATEIVAAAADTTPPTVTLGPIAEGVIDTAQDHDITFNEAVTGLVVADFSVSTNIVASGDLVVNSVTPASGPSTTYTISITPRATAFTLTLAADSVMDLATSPNLGPETAASAPGTAVAANTAPRITAGNAAPNYAENASAAVATYAATDDEGNDIAWSVAGADAGLFAIDADGELTFKASPNFEDRATYSISITATETNGVPSNLPSEPLAVTVTVTNVDEEGSIGAITGTAQVGVELTAGAVTDSDGAVTGITYQWQSSPSSSNTYTTISGAGTDATYTPVDGDEGNTIQVIATYTDPQGAGKTATSAPTAAVIAAPTPPNQPPTAEAGPAQSVVTDMLVALSGSGNDPDGDNNALTYSWALTGGTGITLSDANIASPTFTPTAAGVYTFTLTVTDAGSPSARGTDTVIITVTAPVITTNTAPVVSGNAAPNYDENASAAVETYAATDAEGNAITWSITGGTDAALFSIAPNSADPNKGELTFNNPPDFENDAHTVTYSITITATETDGAPSNLASAPLAVTVTVTNVDEPGAISDITGTAQVGQTLTAGTVTDPDGAVTGVTYQWQSVESGATTDIGTGMTYMPDADDEGKTIQVIATYTDPQGSGKMATSAATTAVKAASVTPPTDTTPPMVTIPPLGESTVGKPASVKITFSEAVTGLAVDDFSTSIDVTVDSVTPDSGFNTTYIVTYTPAEGPVTLTLAADSVLDSNGNTGPATAEPASGAAKAAATETTTKPRVIATMTIPGLTTTEFDEDKFRMGIADLLGPTVDPDDVRILSIAAGSVVVVYEVVADSVAERDALATALNDADSSALRTASGQTLAPGTTEAVTIDEVETRDATEPPADTNEEVAEVILSEVARVIADQNISAIAGRVERARTQQNGGSSFNFTGQRMSLNGDGNNDQAMSSTVANLMNTHASSMEDGTLDMKTLLGNSEFEMPLNFVGSEDGSGITFWGSGDYRNFGGEDDDQELDWDGDMLSVHFGLDGRTAEAIGGVALSWNEGEMETDTDGTYDISLTSINPYFGWGGARGEVWMTTGYGAGEIEGDDGAGATSGNDLSMSTFAIGGNGIVRQRGASTLRLKGEVSQSTLEVDANKDGSGLKASEVDTNRVRVSLESTNTIALDNGARTERSAEAGIRHDGGDGATGSGAELGFGISHVNANGFSVEGKARVLVGHSGNTNEWGVSGAIKKTAGADGQGWSFALSPGYGDDAGDMQRLWDEGLRDADGDGNATDTAADATRDYAARLDLRVGYGMNGFTGPSWLGSGRGLLTPYTAMTLSNDSNRYRLGIQWKLGDRLDLDLVGEHRDADDDDDAILLKGELRF